MGVFQLWLQGYSTLFSAPCHKCGKYLQNSMPPTWRDFRTRDPYHDGCRQWASCESPGSSSPAPLSLAGSDCYTAQPAPWWLLAVDTGNECLLPLALPSTVRAAGTEHWDWSLFSPVFLAWRDCQCETWRVPWQLRAVNTGDWAIFSLHKLSVSSMWQWPGQLQEVNIGMACATTSTCSQH